METRRTANNSKDLNRTFGVTLQIRWCDGGLEGGRGVEGDQSDEKQSTKLSEPGSKVIS